MPTGICYWKHDIKLDESFPCYDGKSTGCNHCCVEACPKESPQGFAASARAGHPNWPSLDRGRRVPAKLVVLESYWDNRLFQTMSVKGFFESMGPLHDPPLQLAHRFVESQRGLAHYTASPGGLLWRDPGAVDARRSFISPLTARRPKLSRFLNPSASSRSATPSRASA